MTKFVEKKKIEQSSLIKIEKDIPVYVTINGEIQTGTVKKKPAFLAPVTNLETGEVGKMIIATALYSSITDAYPNASYVDKSFKIVKGDKKTSQSTGNDYNTFELWEVEAK